MADMDYSDKKVLQEVLIKWYGPQANSWDMNCEVLRVVVKMVGKMQSCTTSMHFLPMPIAHGNPVS